MILKKTKRPSITNQKQIYPVALTRYKFITACSYEAAVKLANRRYSKQYHIKVYRGVCDGDN